MSSRSYDASGRRTAAAGNRTRVVAAATELLVTKGYASTTVAEVAAAAGVSVPFVYAAFGNKVGLLKRVLDVAIAGDDEPVAVRDRADAVAAIAARTARRRCQLTAELVTRISARTAPLIDVVRQAAGTISRSPRWRRRARSDAASAWASSSASWPATVSCGPASTSSGRRTSSGP